ncbi:phosphonate C-P lyase system protein PhnH [Burkholderia cepacia]|uniref:phosphonate C-P lyase system protein PhnH n=1 Tax=Burkholderia cepacia TaxID=292 RepID=UPI002AB7077A|nr:phosphonate C-P lyase system protein PhnH [Burkholderia cepacia]
MIAVPVAPHFGDPIHDAQAAFRGLLKALSRPGTRVPLPGSEMPPAPMGAALAAVALTLADGDCPVWLDAALDSADIHRYLHIHTNAARVAAPEAAVIALIAEPQDMPQFSVFRNGEAAYPDRSATIVIQVPALEGGGTVTLRGPGIETATKIAPRGLPDWFWPAWIENTSRYPLGVDIFLVDRGSVIGLPRTTKVESR